MEQHTEKLQFSYKPLAREFLIPFFVMGMFVVIPSLIMLGETSSYLPIIIGIGLTTTTLFNVYWFCSREHFRFYETYFVVYTLLKKQEQKFDYKDILMCDVTQHSKYEILSFETKGRQEFAIVETHFKTEEEYLALKKAIKNHALANSRK